MAGFLVVGAMLPALPAAADAQAGTGSGAITIAAANPDWATGRIAVSGSYAGCLGRADCKFSWTWRPALLAVAAEPDGSCPTAVHEWKTAAIHGLPEPSEKTERYLWVGAPVSGSHGAGTPPSVPFSFDAEVPLPTGAAAPCIQLVVFELTAAAQCDWPTPVEPYCRTYGYITFETHLATAQLRSRQLEEATARAAARAKLEKSFSARFATLRKKKLVCYRSAPDQFLCTFAWTPPRGDRHHGVVSVWTDSEAAVRTAFSITRR